jgi:hypothetical protein
MVTAMFAETFDNSRYSTRLTPESRSFTLNAIRENLQFSKSVPEIKAVSTTKEWNGVMYWETQLGGPKYEQSIS